MEQDNIKNAASNVEMLPKDECDYDVFISYKAHVLNIKQIQKTSDGKRMEVAVKDSVGCAIARQLAQPLKSLGYRVFFDRDEDKDIENVIDQMRRSRVVLIVLADFCFDRLYADSNFAKELRMAEQLYRQDEHRLIFLNFNDLFHPENSKYEDSPYRWLKDVEYTPYNTNRFYRATFDELVQKISEQISKPSEKTSEEIINALKEQNEKQKRSYKRWLVVLLLFAVAITASWLFMDRLSFAGGGTAKNYVTDKLHVRIDPKSYWPTPSGSAAIHLSEYAKSKNGNPLGCNIPAVLSAEPFTASTFNGDTSSFEGTVHLLELLIGYADMQVLVYPCDSTQCNSTITVSQLVKLLLDKNTIIATTSSSSGTYKKYKDVLSVSCNLDSVQEQKKRDNQWLKFYSGNAVSDLESIVIKMKGTTLVVLENEHYHYLKQASNKAKELTLVDDAVNDTLRIPLYVYTVIWGANSKNIKVHSLRQKWFLRKLGYNIVSYTRDPRGAYWLIPDTVGSLKMVH